MKVIIKHEERIEHIAAVVQEVKPESSMVDILRAGDEILTIDNFDISSWALGTADISKGSDYKIHVTQRENTHDNKSSIDYRDSSVTISIRRKNIPASSSKNDGQYI